MKITSADLFELDNPLIERLDQLEEEYHQLSKQAEYLSEVRKLIVKAIQEGQFTDLDQVDTAILLAHTCQSVFEPPEVIESVLD